ncbi:MAG TPA: TonB-dependent receptor [Terriglobia bacterium]|nr:TonB-dependent receptor [Terriglobia bacterium]
MRFLLALTLLIQSGGRQLDVAVSDTQGLAIEGARVTVTEQQGSLKKTSVSATDGARFENLGAALYDVRIDANGFATKTLQADLRNQTTAALKVELELARLDEERVNVVTRTEQVIGDMPASATVLRADEIEQSPAVVADDILRQVPTFSLFRRTSSLVAHPTTQGVSLRGIGPSGVSRTLVLWDGIPLNDPFGGWVYWHQLDKNSLQQVEIAAGGGSSLYGSSALGGVIQMLSRSFEANHLELDMHGGSQATAGADLLGSAVRGPWSGNFSGSFLHTDGYLIVPPSVRGLVDDRAGSVRYALRAGGFYKPDNGRSLFLQGTHFAEDRDNGTQLQRNDTDITSLRLGYRHEGSNGREWQLRGYGLVEKFFSNFTAISADRRLETLTLDQTVPVKSAGGSAQWTGLLFSRHLVTSGLDWQWIRGNSEELGYTAGRPARFQVTGGSQQLGGIFVQDLFTPTSRWVIQLGARLDGWTNYDAQRREVLLSSGALTTTPFVTQKRGTINPKAGVSYRVREQFTLRGSYYHSFRAPTLNELYRGFRVGNVQTNPNDQLGPEKLKGVEGGMDWHVGSNVTARFTGFWNQLENAVSNVTVSSLPALITRRRENVGEIHAQGIETSLSVRWRRDWSLQGAYLWSDSRVTEFPPNPVLESKILPQVPQHRVSASLSYSNVRALTAFVSARFVGAQYDDDLNALLLGNFVVLDLHVSRTLHRSLRVYASAENVFDRRFAVAKTPLENIGAPRMVHAGLKLIF